jgi:hypothetical protein
MLRRDQIGLGLTVFVGVIDGHANEMATAFEEAIVAFPEVVAARMNQIISVLDSYAYRTLVWDIYVERVSRPASGEVADEERIAAA